MEILTKRIIAAGLLGVLTMSVTPLQAAQKNQWTAKSTVKGKPVTLKFTKAGDGRTVKVTVLDAASKAMAEITLEVRKGIDETVRQACRAQEIMEKGKAVAGCVATASAGLCLYTGAGGGIAAGYCITSIDYAVTTGALDCLKGASGEIAKLLGEEEAFKFFQDATITPADVISRSIEKACEAFSNRK